tara:strand:- start:51 stop:716 length:666 start_codon:yes stop_codon:yes gene_type:complete
MALNIIFCGYRSWAIDLLNDLCNNTEHCIIHVTSPESLSNCVKESENYIIILAGWSWYITPKILSQNTVVGLHPSDLPNYAGGSPIQNQILDGLTKTKLSLFELNENYDEGNIISKCDLNLEKGITEIFLELRYQGLKLLLEFLDTYPNHISVAQDLNVPHIKCKRLKPSDSELTPDKLLTLSTRDLYNMIRCREDPYPNVFLEDSEGKLLFKKIEFIKKR